MKRALILAMLLSALSPVQAAKAGGGWASWINVGTGHMAPGQEVTVRADAMFDSIEAAEEAFGSELYHAYLLPNFALDDMRWPDGSDLHWWEPPSEVIYLGPVEFTRSDANLVWTTATFEVPDIPLGRHALMFCTRGCAEAMANTVPTSIRLVADPATASLAGQVDRMNYALDRARSRIRRLERPAAQNRVEFGRLDPRITALAQRVAALEQAADDEEPAPRPWWPAALGGLVAGLAGAIAVSWVRRRRRHVYVPAIEMLEVKTDDSELVRLR